MNEYLEFRRARPADAGRIMEIIRQAQAQMRALGSLQWQDGYPAPENIDDDIARGNGYVLERRDMRPDALSGATGELPGHLQTEGIQMEELQPEGSQPEGSQPEETQAATDTAENTAKVIAYGAVAFDGEQAYDAIEGTWLTDGDYVVLHRLAVADEEKGRGRAREFMLRVEAAARRRGVGSFRVDTNFDNRYMLRLLARLGFVYCGKVRYRSGERLAFEKPFGL